jgi:hypothetical protein
MRWLERILDVMLFICLALLTTLLGMIAFIMFKSLFGGL